MEVDGLFNSCFAGLSVTLPDASGTESEGSAESVTEKFETMDEAAFGELGRNRPEVGLIVLW